VSLLVLVVSLAVAVAGLPATASAEPGPETADAPAPTGESGGAVERPDRVSAMVTARATGERVEDLSQRDEFSQVFANPDGTWTAETASEPERVRDTDGVWHRIDTTLVERDGGLAPAYAATDVVLSAGGDATFATVTEAGRRLQWRWPSTLPEPIVDGDTATYPGAVAGGGDLVVTATPTGFTHNIVLHRAPTEPVRLTMPVATGGTELAETPQGGLEITTRAGDTLVAAPQPLMWDSSQDPAGEPENVAAVDTTVGETASGTPTLTLSPDAGFLADPDTVYPVTVDPSFTTYTNGDVWVQNADYTSGQTSSPELRAGTYDGGGHKARSFLRFDNGTAKWKGKDIESASLVLRNWYSGSCTGAAIRANWIDETWDGNNLTWGNQPTVAPGRFDDYTTAKGYTSACAGGDASWDLTSMVQYWANGGAANNGIRLAAVDESSIYTWRKYRSANYATSTQRPHINVTYNSYPNTAGKPSLTPGNTGYSTSLTPTLRSTVSDPDGGTVKGRFEVWVAGGALVWSGTSAGVSSGGTATVTVPAGKLVNGTSYSVRVKANDTKLDSVGWSGWHTVKADTSAPAAPAVTATGFTSGQWSEIPPASNQFSFDGDADVASFSYQQDTGGWQPLAADSSGDATLGWRPTSGSHTLLVTAIDEAGNTGATSTFSFGVGGVSVAAPSTAARSTGQFPIAVSGPPTATGATLSWRYAGQTGWTPMDAVTTATGSAWSGAVANTADAATLTGLVWDASAQQDPATGQPVQAPALLEIRACLDYPAGTPQACSTPRTVQLVPSAFGGSFPVTGVGPATVALFTGEMTLTEGDAVDKAGVGRTFAAFDGSTSRPGAFGPGWATSLFAPGDSGAALVDHRGKDRTLVLVSTGGSSQMFTPVDPNLDPVNPSGPVEFRPAGVDDGSRLVLDGTTVTVTRPQGPVTTWLQSTDGEWELQSAASTEESGAEPEVVVDEQAPGYPTWIAQTEPGESTTCTQTVQEPGCRGLSISYTGAGQDQRVNRIERVAHGAPTTTLATYTYDAEGRLATVCGPDPDGAGSLAALCAGYEYDTTTVSGRTLLKRLTPPGQQPWQFGYDPTGRLTTVTRVLDTDSSTGTGPATWTLAYDLAPTAAGLPDLTAATAAHWGQTTVPSRAFAVFTPAHVPSATPTSADLQHASLWFTDDTGSTTNTAVHGNLDGAGQWLVDTSWYDEHGNLTRTLDGAGRARALAADPADRARVAGDASTFTVFNADGTRVQDEYGPVHTATLADGTTGPFRAHTSHLYDDQAPGLGGGSKPALPEGQTGFNLVVETRHSATGPDMVGEYDSTVVRNEYDPVVAGDGNGWELGTPTRVKTQLEDGSWSTTVTRYDAQGRQIETRQPGGAANGDGSGGDAHATLMSYYAPESADPDCTSTGHADRAGWAGLPCKTGPAAQPTGPSMPITYHAGYNDQLQPTRVEETSGGTTRLTTTSYDALGRPLTTTITDGTDTRATTTGYDPATGLPTTQSGAGSTITTVHDTWGRVWKYTDATGLTSTTTYTTDGQVASFNDGEGAYGYRYDEPAGEHRRLPTSVAVGFTGGTPDTFTLGYDAAGAQAKVSFPNGMVATHTHDEVGVPTALEYTDGDGQALLSFTGTVDVDGRVLAYTSGASQQDYTHDALGRLTQVRDTRNGQCTTRSYGFTAASERSTFASYSPDVDGACQTTAPAMSRTSSYDTANRIRNTGYGYDDLGRTLTTPAADTAPGAAGPLAATYYANDMVKSLTQTVDDAAGGTIAKETSYGLDPTGRIDTITNTTEGAETTRMRYRFSDQSDTPTSIQTSTDAGANWTTTRYITVPGIGMVASMTGEAITYQLANLHGDVVATQTHQPGPLSIDTYNEADEYGNPIDTASGRYGWLGTHQRSTDSMGGMVLMGARAYNPTTGLFLTSDPVLNGGANRYSYPTDPVNLHDLSGSRWGIYWVDRKTWYSSFYNFWNAPAHWYNYRGTKYLVHLMNYARDRLANGSLDARSVLGVAIVSAILGKHPFAGPLVAGALGASWMHVTYVARTAQRQRRGMRITFYFGKFSSVPLVHAWLER
jgi:RHS repeat-associated protein